MENEIDQALEAEIAKALEPCKRVLSEGIKAITDSFNPPKAEPQERKTS